MEIANTNGSVFKDTVASVEDESLIFSAIQKEKRMITRLGCDI